MACIYKLTVSNQIYIGCTTNLPYRITQHKYTINNKNSKAYNNLLYTAIRENNNKFEFEKIYDLKIQELNTARQIEQHYIDTLDPSLNSINSYMTADEIRAYRRDYSKSQHGKQKQKQYYQNNKEKYKLRGANYYRTNKEQINAKRYQKVTCACGAICNKSNLTNHKRSKWHINFINRV